MAMSYGFPEIPHAPFPNDGFGHIESMDCPCNPVVNGIAWLCPPMVCHNRMDNIDFTVPDTLPEEWE